MYFTINEKKTEHGLLVIITDSNLIDKKFEEGKLQLDLTKKFYSGEEKNKEEAIEIIKRARHLHLTGENSVSLGINLNLVDRQTILEVSGIPHAEVVIE